MKCPDCNSIADGQVCRKCGYIFPADPNPADDAGQPGTPQGDYDPDREPDQLSQEPIYIDPYSQQNPNPASVSQNGEPFPGKPLAEDGPQPKRRWVLPAILGGAVLVIAAVVLFAFVLPAMLPSTATPPTYATATAAPSVSDTGTVGPSTPDTSETVTAATGVECWDESKADTVEACPAPVGAEAIYQYIRYAYPSLTSHSFCEKQDATQNRDYTGTTVMWNCELGTSLLRYRYWEEASDGTGHYTRKFAGKKTRVAYDVHLQGSDATLRGYAKEATNRTKDEEAGTDRFMTSVWLPQYHLSLTAEGDTRVDMRKALELVRIRPPEELMGHATGAEPGGLALTFTKR